MATPLDLANETNVRVRRCRIVRVIDRRSLVTAVEYLLERPEWPSDFVPYPYEAA